MTSDRPDQQSNDFEWRTAKQQDGISHIRTTTLQITNPDAPLPEGIDYLPGFVSIEEELDIAREIDESLFKKEGFDVQKRVQRFGLSSLEAGGDRTANDDNAPIPKSLLNLKQKLEKVLGIAAQVVTIEDIPIVGGNSNRSRKGDFASNHIATTFESLASCPDDCVDCFVAYIPLRSSAIQHWNRPARRDSACWSLLTPQHWTDVRLARGSALIRREDSLHNWRSCFIAKEDDAPVPEASKLSSSTVRIIKFYSLPKASASLNHNQTHEEDSFGYVPRPGTLMMRSESLRPLKDLLTIIITTSPIKSHPSTELLERAMDTFVFGGSEFAFECRKVIVCGECVPFLLQVLMGLAHLTTHASQMGTERRRKTITNPYPESMQTSNKPCGTGSYR